MLEIALEYGISINEFWDYSLAEIMLIVKAKQKQETRKYKEKAVLGYNFVNLIGFSVARIMDDKVKMPTLYEMFPTLFEEERELEIEAENQRQALLIKERLMKYAQAHNKKWGEKIK